MTIERISDTQSQLEELHRAYDAAGPYLAHLRIGLVALLNGANLQTCNSRNSHQDRDLWSGRGEGYSHAIEMLDQCYENNAAMLESKVRNEQAKQDAESGKAVPAGKPDSRGRDDSEVYEDDDY